MFALIRFVFSLILSFRLLLALSGLVLIVLVVDALTAQGAPQVRTGLAPVGMTQEFVE